ncbi:amino acid ABC transporter permease [Microbacterium sp. NPDC055910]|uniref:amino acid ABC transporter permease n=1 Tax=Microbacterium sp. NPDC055910 TaxID=3345659 RepID=UPI0035DDBE20
MTAPDSEAVWRVRANSLGAAPHEQHSHIVRNSMAGLVLLVAVVAIIDFVMRPALGWPVVWEYLFAPSVMQGIGNTLLLTVLSMSLALVASVILANMRLSANPVLRAISGIYVWFFRSIPLLVLLILWFNIAIIYPRIAIGVPFGPEWWAIDTSTVVSGFWAAVFAFGFQQAAYTSEVIRASLLAVPAGQREAAAAIGMTKPLMFFRIVLPQAMRIAIPPISNDTINLLKATSLAAFISVPDLLYSVQTIYNRTYDIVPLLLVATIWYAVFVSVLSYGQYHLERALSRDRRAVR